MNGVALSPEAVLGWGRSLLTAAFALGLCFVLMIGWAASEYIHLVPVAVLGLGLLVVLARYPLAQLTAILCGLVLIAKRVDGFSAAEILYALYAFGYLATWFAKRLTSRESKLAPDIEDKVLLAFLILTICSAPLTILFGGSLRILFSEVVALLFFAFYFPVKDACIRFRNGIACVLGAVAFVGIAIAIRNLIEYRHGLVEATIAAEVMGERVASNEILLHVGGLLFLIWFLFNQKQWRLPLLLAGWALLVTSLVLSLSRGYWVAYAFGVFFVFALSPPSQKKRLLLFSIGSAVLLTGGAMLFLQDYVEIVALGLTRRFSTLATATSDDISLVNRFVEAKVVLGYILKNPVLGYGMGVPYEFFDLIFRYTRIDIFIHNGYISLWYKFGLWGLGLMLTFYTIGFLRGVRAFRMHHAQLTTRMAGLLGASGLISIALVAISSNPFHHKDAVMCLVLLIGLASGSFHKAKAEHIRSSVV